MIVTREFRFEAAHRLPHHGGKCKHLHGHSYRVEVQVEAVVDSSTGISVDFGDMKPLGKWIDDYLDHATLVWRGDSQLLTFLSDGGQKRFITDRPPTAETLASLLKTVASELIAGGVVRFVRVWETVNCSALAGVIA